MIEFVADRSCAPPDIWAKYTEEPSVFNSGAGQVTVFESIIVVFTKFPSTRKIVFWLKFSPVATSCPFSIYISLRIIYFVPSFRLLATGIEFSLCI